MRADLFWHKRLRLPYQLHITRYGQADKPVIVFLHGIAASSEDWSKLIPLLQNEYQCITIDLLGFAKSPKPQWYAYTMEDHLRNIRHTIRQLHIRGPFILAGHSLGSLLATRYARDHPRRVCRLLLLSPPIYPPADTILSPAARRRTAAFLKLYKFLRTNPRITPENFKRLSYLLPLPKSVSKHPETWTPFLRTLEECIENQTIIEDVIDITMPIDIFYGTLDQVVIAYNLRQLAENKGVTLHAFRGNHSIGRTYAKTVAQVLLEG